MRYAPLFICLALVQGCIALAASNVAANHASRPLDDTNPPTSSGSISDVCDNLNNCRSLVSIITSCLATIFACVWSAVYPNVPGPKQSWISRQLESFKIIIVTLLVPEWVLAWALRQFLQARYYGQRLETAREWANGRRPDGPEAISTTRNNPGGDSAGGKPDEKGTNLLREMSTQATQVPQALTHKHVNSWEEEKDLGRTNHPWTTRHGFLASMGGFHYYRGETPMFPLQVERGVGRTDKPNEDHSLLRLVKLGLLVPPTSQELVDKSKVNPVSKGTALFQTLWFITRCLGRHQEQLAITNLELMTSGYAVITVAMNVLWAEKPLKVHCAIRVQGDEEFVKNTEPFKGSDIIDYVTGNQDRLTPLSGEGRVPTFWSGELPRHADSELPHHADSELSHHATRFTLYANISGLMATVVFGALHCTAWSYNFPSFAERLMWRACALFITAIPVPMGAAFLVFDPSRTTARSGLSAYIRQLCMALCVLLYILARIFLLVLSFSTLRRLPPSAYQSVQWTKFIPHV
ncbi:hypothetical protein FIBSPDRAFT_943080 [Athelia psychrophila]|uniref:Uncharacterized protein n=1 Tax=Athelia psychrophila TaxID=1759441 RepID=A0A166WQQ0_9AGAM|nr:hypothetical protein FIBSPDRAFT_943080 [Fibularhizoctonia sp. CBS 109695]